MEIAIPLFILFLIAGALWKAPATIEKTVPTTAPPSQQCGAIVFGVLLLIVCTVVGCAVFVAFIDELRKMQ